MEKSVTIAYILWFFFGITGIHLFYLRRDRHAFFTWATFGGFGLSLLRDMFYIPQYAADANENEEYMVELNEKMRKNEKPAVSTSRFVANMGFGYILATLIYATFWTDELSFKHTIALALLAHLVAAVGVYFLSNEGRAEVSFQSCLFGSMIPSYWTVKNGFDQLFWGPAISTVFAWRYVKWRRTPRTAGFCKRVFFLSVCALMYLGLIVGGIYFNGTITSNGEKVPVKVAIHNFFKSPAWRETKDTLWGLYEYYKANGWRTLWEHFKESLDPRGESNAYKVLGLDSSATQEEIKSTYKKLARQWHPDKIKDPEKKTEAHEKFMEIQQSYDILSSSKQSRSKQNKKSSKPESKYS